VAALAGVPQAVIAEARRKLQELESPHALAPVAKVCGAPAQGQLLFDADPRRDALLERLRALDPDALSPREAHALLCELHGAAREIY